MFDRTVSDQADTRQSNIDQVESETDTEGNDQDSQSDSGYVDLDGQKVSINEIRQWKQGSMRDSDYRRKTQELAEEKRRLQAREAAMDPDVENVIETLKQSGEFMTKQDFEAKESEKIDQKQLNSIIKEYPQLSKYKKAIQSIGKTTDAAWEDIIVENGFLEFDENGKIQQAKATEPGRPRSKVRIGNQEKSVMDMTSEEWAEYRKGLSKEERFKKSTL